MLFGYVLIFILGSHFFLLAADALVYQPGVKPGMWMKYEFLHYSDIKEANVTVTAVEGNLVTLNTVSIYNDGTTIEENHTINVERGDKTTLVPTDKVDGWESIHGTNIIMAVNDHMEIIMVPNDGFAEFGYTFQEPLDLSELSYFYYFISIADIVEGEKYTLWMTDVNGQSKFFPVQFDVDDPRKSKFVVWDKIEWFNFDTIPLEEIDRAQISSISLVYDGNSTRTVKLRNFETDQPLDHGFGFFKYFVVSAGLVNGDLIYPDVASVINEELPNDDQPEPIILQHSYRDFIVSFADCDGGFCSSAYTYDKETGILTRFWTAQSGIQIQLVDQKNVWSPPNVGLLALALVHEGWINYILPNIWYIVGIISIYIIGYAGTAIYDKWKRGTLSLGMMKQWWPFLVILLIIFLLGEAIRRIGI